MHIIVCTAHYPSVETGLAEGCVCAALMSTRVSEYFTCGEILENLGL